MPYGSFLHISPSQHFREELALINVCTFIALFMAKLFSVNNNATVNISNEPSSPPVWLGILSITIQAGNSVNDSVRGVQPIMIGNFSVNEAMMYLNGGISKTKVEETLDIGFTNENPLKSTTILFTFLS